jgi:hypothetical protein
MPFTFSDPARYLRWSGGADIRPTPNIAEALPVGNVGRVLPGIHPGAAVHVLIRQCGPAGQDEAVDQLLDLVEDFKHRGRNPAEMPAAFWTAAAQELLLCQVPMESFDLEGVVCRV